MKYAVDEIIDNIVILENIETNEKIEVIKESIPFMIEEGNIIHIQNNQYQLDKQEEYKRRRELRNKLNQLKRND